LPHLEQAALSSAVSNAFTAIPTAPVAAHPEIASLPVSPKLSCNAIITVVGDPIYPLGKRFTLNPDGTISKTANVNVSLGTAKMHRVDTFEQLVTLLEIVGKDCHGAIINAYFLGIEVGERFLILSATELEERTGIPVTDRERQSGVHQVTYNGKSYKAVCRFKENVEPSCWQLFDRDVDQHTPAHFAEMDLAQWVQAVDKIVPGFANLTFCHVPSTSSRVLKDGKPVGAGNGHVWVKFANPADLERFRAAIMVCAAQVDMTWLKPRHSRTEPGTVVGQSLCTIIDPSVFTLGRLVFEGKPVVSEGLTVLPLTAVIHTGTTETLDTTATILPEADVVREVTRKAGAEMSVCGSGTSLRISAQDLSLDTEIETKSHGNKTVRELLALGIEGKIRCQTPFRDSSSYAAIFNVNADGKPYVYDSGTNTTHWLNEFDADDVGDADIAPAENAESKKANGKKVTAKVSVSKFQQTSVLTAIQQQFGLINMNGKLCVFDRTALETHTEQGTAQKLTLSNRSDGALLIMRALTAGCTDPDANIKKVLAQFWVSSQTVCYAGVDFRPNGLPDNYLNLWIGPTIVPAAGSWALIQAFLLVIICGGNQAHYDYLIAYIAHALQHPEDKPGVMIILLGGQGIGKGTLARILQLIWSATFLQVSNVDAVTGSFNAALERTFIVFMDEALFAGDRRASDALKSLVTEPVIYINEKHQPARQTHSYHRFFAATNADHLKNTDRDDRRDFSLRVSEARKGDHAYWTALNEEIQNGGTQAMVHDLLAMDLSGFNVRAKPHTQELLEQKLQSLEPIARWWYGRLVDGELGADDDWPDFLATDAAIAGVMDFTGGKLYRKPSAQDIVKALKKLCPSAVPDQKETGLGRKRGLELPPLEKARSDFDRYIGAAVTW